MPHIPAIISRACVCALAWLNDAWVCRWDENKRSNMRMKPWIFHLIINKRFLRMHEYMKYILMSMFATEQAKSHDLSHQNEKDAAFCRLILQNKFLFPETGCIKSSFWVFIFSFSRLQRARQYLIQNCNPARALHPLSFTHKWSRLLGD